MQKKTRTSRSKICGYFIRIRLMFRAAMYYISGALFIREISGGANLRQIERALSDYSSMESRYLRTTLVADRTSAGFECAKLGMILVTKDSSTWATTRYSAMKSRM